MTTTLVSAFLIGINNDKKIEDMITRGKILYNVKKPKIFFIDKKIINQFHDDEYTKIIPISIEDLFLFQYIEKVNSSQVGNKNKDTLLYMALMCNKTEFLRNAIGINPFNSDQFIWVDFSINHIYKTKIDNETLNDFFTNIEFINNIYDLYNKKYDNLRISGIWDINIEKNINPITQVLWYFAGGVFGGDINSILIFSDLVKNKCIEIINKFNTFIWEVNIFYLVYLDSKDVNLFNIYKCNHDNSIIVNY